MSTNVDCILDQFKALTVAQQMEVAQAIDRLTWASRWAAVCERISAPRRGLPPPDDRQIDEAVRQVRQEKPLSARRSTPPS